MKTNFLLHSLNRNIAKNIRIDGRIGSGASRKGSILQGSTPSPIRFYAGFHLTFLGMAASIFLKKNEDFFACSLWVNKKVVSLHSD
jgi:hypothetical protein